MDKRKFSRVLTKAKTTVTKHKPEILMAIGIGCMVTSTVTAIKATPKALQLLEAAKEAQEVDELPVVETVKATWKCYIPTAVSGLVGIGCLIGASSVSARRSAALATAYKLSETALAEYKEKVVETIGEKKEKTVEEKIVKDKVEKLHSLDVSEIYDTGKGDTDVYEVTFGRRFKSSINQVRHVKNIMNDRLNKHDYISLNEYYTELGLPPTEIGDVLGWNIVDGLVELNEDTTLINDTTLCFTIAFSRPPRYDYDRY